MEKPHLLQPSVCFYIHHHGAGHVMRAINIADGLTDFKVCFLGSNLKPFLSLISDKIECIHLPLDLPVKDDLTFVEKQLTFLHYAPLGLNGQRDRISMLTDIFKYRYPVLLIVDVSVEITLLARLCGIPTIVIRQHGKRDDLPHLLAYESAELLVAPFSETMASLDEEPWVKAKTLYAGGFSKYTADTNYIQEQTNCVAILIGQGGTSIDTQFIHLLAHSCKDYIFHVIGQLEGSVLKNHPNILYHGRLNDPLDILLSCAVVIGNAGHNTVMEMASLNKRFICIPENRPFDEQLEKARFLKINGNATVINVADLNLINWPDELNAILQKEPNWLGVINKNAVYNIVNTVKQTVNSLFGNPVL